MRIGRLDRRITLNQMVPTVNDFGERVDGFSQIAEVWANIDTRGGSEPAKSETEFPIRKLIFTIRYRTDVGPDDVIVYKSDTYEIQTVEETHYTRNRFMKLHAVLKGVQDG